MEACLWLVSCCILCSLWVAGAQPYSVSQTHVFNVLETGKVDVLLSIVFQLPQGGELASSYKSILSDTSLKSVDNGIVKATDVYGRSLEVSTLEREGWLLAEFAFPEVINGNITSNYTVNLEYSILQSICANYDGFEQLSFPWAHRWAVDVTNSRYVIKFSKVMKNAMDVVCIGATGWGRSLCGRRNLNINGTTAEYRVEGFLHGIFFEWASPLDLTGGRLCPGVVLTTAPPAKDESTDVESPVLPEAAMPNTRNASMGLIIVLAIASAVCMFAATLLLCALRVPVAPPKGAKPKKKARKNPSNANSQVNLDIKNISLPPQATQQKRSSGMSSSRSPPSSPVSKRAVSPGDANRELPSAKPPAVPEFPFARSAEDVKLSSPRASPVLQRRADSEDAAGSDPNGRRPGFLQRQKQAVTGRLHTFSRRPGAAAQKRAASKPPDLSEVVVEDQEPELAQASSAAPQASPEPGSAEAQAHASSPPASPASQRPAAPDAAARSDQHNQQHRSFFQRFPGFRQAHDINKPGPAKSPELGEVVVDGQAAEVDPWAMVEDEFNEEDRLAADTGAGVWDAAEDQIISSSNQPTAVTMGIQASARMTGLNEAPQVADQLEVPQFPQLEESTLQQSPEPPEPSEHSQYLKHEDLSTREGDMSSLPSLDEISNAFSGLHRVDSRKSPRSTPRKSWAVDDEFGLDDFASHNIGVNASSVANHNVGDLMGEFQAVDDFQMGDDVPVVQPAQTVDVVDVGLASSWQPPEPAPVQDRVTTQDRAITQDVNEIAPRWETDTEGASEELFGVATPLRGTSKSLIDKNSLPRMSL